MAQTQYVPGLIGPEPSNLASSELRSGAGTPADTLGNDGDGYVDTTNLLFYIKSGGTWVLGGGGSGVTCGVGDPVDPPTGTCGAYINTDTEQIFWYYSGAWH